ncbi:hypothetical protein C8F04DRAFT_1146439 [Mycena alexandri]|uniref:Uncharacterized protein n=1 Tax=Mycena alexandri TaxID=1745969 RepID=A0AAD6WMI3_9AGAR|nr:hypothetical protein C8F04DRAFT_1146439 [Mycena alexandri]
MVYAAIVTTGLCYILHDGILCSTPPTLPSNTKTLHDKSFLNPNPPPTPPPDADTENNARKRRARWPWISLLSLAWIVVVSLSAALFVAYSVDWFPILSMSSPATIPFGSRRPCPPSGLQFFASRFEVGRLLAFPSSHTTSLGIGATFGPWLHIGYHPHHYYRWAAWSQFGHGSTLPQMYWCSYLYRPLPSSSPSLHRLGFVDSFGWFTTLPSANSASTHLDTGPMVPR